MRIIVKIFFCSILLSILSGCANNSSQSMSSTNSYSPATTNQSYLFRGPPPPAAIKAHYSGGR